MTTLLAPAVPKVPTVEWPVRGRFDLRQSIGFGFGSTVPGRGSVLRLAFVLDGYDAQAGGAGTPPAAAPVRVEGARGAGPEAAPAPAARGPSPHEGAAAGDRGVGPGPPPPPPPA